MTNNNGITLKQRITQEAKEWAETCFVDDFTEAYNSCPRRVCDVAEALKDYVESVTIDGDEEALENQVLLLGAMSFEPTKPYDDNPLIDWNQVLEYVEALYDAWVVENKEEESESEEESEDEERCESCNKKVTEAFCEC